MGYQGETGYELLLSFIHSGVRMSIQWMVWLVCADGFNTPAIFFKVANFLQTLDRKRIILTNSFFVTKFPHLGL
jgi:hypothetical protein